MFNVSHCGLYFTNEAILQARKHREKSPYAEAWKRLNEVEQYDLLSQVVWNGLRYRFNDDTHAGQNAFVDLTNEQLTTIDENMPYLTAISKTLATAQVFEMVRNHPDLSPEQSTAWLNRFTQHVTDLNHRSKQITYAEQIWLATLNAAAGVVLEDGERLQSAAQVYRQVIDHDIHPQGYISAIVEGQNSYHQFVMVVQGLTLFAEIATHAGINLWAYSNRGVSIATAGLYPLYYYYYPEKWLWSKDLQTDETNLIFRQHGSYLEMLNQHLGQTTKAVDLILDEIRPVFDVYGGGLTTLTHALPPKRGFFG